MKRTDGFKSTYIGSITLTSNLQAVTVPSTTKITKILIDTRDGTEFEIALESNSTDTFSFCKDRATAPFVFDYDRYYDSDDIILFYVKGFNNSVFQFITFVK